jgi:hypothetical protein
MKQLKFKTATPHAYCELAVAKEKSKGSIAHVYRACEYLLATDGHRLHRVSQPRIETPHSLGGSDLEFPDVSSLDTPRELLCEFHANDALLTHLRAVIAVAGKQAPLATLTFSDGGKISGTLEVTEDLFFHRSLTFTLPYGRAERNATISINLRYLVEAIVWGGNGAFAKLLVGKDGEVVKVENCNGFEAFIMPVRLPKRG